ncbi:MAG: hypothetical protein ACREME_05085 [Gemmatimonadales bacterium]
MSRPLIVVSMLVVLAGCERPDEAARTRALAARALRGMLAYPQSTVLTIAAGDEAAQIVLTSSAPVRDIAGWYRKALALNGWELRSVREHNDSVTMYAEREGQPVWITLRPNAGGRGATYTLVGTIPTDSARADSGR